MKRSILLMMTLTAIGLWAWNFQSSHWTNLQASSPTSPFSIVSMTPTFTPSRTLPSMTPTRTSIRPTPPPTKTYSITLDISKPEYVPKLEKLSSGSPFALSSLQMVDDASGWGVETTGHILRTLDGGLTWRDVTPPEGAYAPGGLFALDENTAWATKNIPLSCYAGDRGYEPDCNLPIHQAVRTGVIWKTVDGGQNWQPSQPFLIDYELGRARGYYPRSIQFVDALHGWALIHYDIQRYTLPYTIYRTQDGGLTWERVFSTEWMAAYATFMVFTDPLNGWLGGNSGNAPVDCSDQLIYLHRTRDGGATWEETAITSEISHLKPVDLARRFQAALINPCGLARGQILRDGTIGLHLSSRFNYDQNQLDWDAFVLISKTGAVTHSHMSGEHFFIHSNTGDIPYYRAGWSTDESEYYLDQMHGWRILVGPRRWLQFTQDGGMNWTVISVIPWKYATLQFSSLHRGWLLANCDYASILPCALFTTGDGGRTWERIGGIIE